jgi:hypothetical protein
MRNQQRPPHIANTADNYEGFGSIGNLPRITSVDLTAEPATRPEAYPYTTSSAFYKRPQSHKEIGEASMENSADQQTMSTETEGLAQRPAGRILTQLTTQRQELIEPQPDHTFSGVTFANIAFGD